MVASLHRLESMAEQTSVQNLNAALDFKSRIPKGVPLDEARCYSYICAPEEICYAPRCPFGRYQRK